MIRLVAAEFSKLRRSFAQIFALLVPAFMPLLVFLVLAVKSDDVGWTKVIGQLMLPLWFLFLMPMAITVFCALAGQIEYRAKAWDQVLSLPFAKPKIFAAKLIVLLVAMVVMNFLLLIYTYGLFGAANALFRPFMTGDPEIAKTFGVMAKILAAGAFMFALLAWASLRFGNFIVTLTIGIGGTLVALAVAMTQTKDADWFPWVLPLRAVDPASGSEPIVIGLVGGAVTVVLALIDLSRKQFR
ncbi:ABC transporter permease [Pseudoblastomonas halimionae]|uniref:ABC transporter permease subunit n=1 Tax=Alteriqipengyuania halimionae TaxID=1926630 RepID=A0A6I4U298_9SPHN|nr:ABC transporter permease [Alteriqipengyuania halimionae]MXP10199.1 ABC transporter permease subunit [Alteriqipengyuania halimionae]